MSNEAKSAERNEVIEEFSKWGVGAGILVVALAPLAIPILVLTGATLAVLALPVIPLVLIAGLIYLPVRIVRGLRTHRRELGDRGGAAEEEVLHGVEFRPLHQ